MRAAAADCHNTHRARADDGELCRAPAHAITQRSWDTDSPSSPTRPGLSPQADPANSTVSPVHLLVMAYCVPTLAFFLVGYNILNPMGHEWLYLVRARGSAAAVVSSGSCFLSFESLARKACGELESEIPPQVALRLTLAVGSLVWTGAKPIVARDSKLVRHPLQSQPGLGQGATPRRRKLTRGVRRR